MPRYYVEITVTYAGHLEADSEAQAEENAWTAYGDTMDNELTYLEVNSITTELDEEIEEEEEEEK
jgi:negative regulator of sigma E activity